MTAPERYYVSTSEILREEEDDDDDDDVAALLRLSLPTGNTVTSDTRSQGWLAAWLAEDDRRRALLMAAGKERLELRRKRRR